MYAVHCSGRIYTGLPLEKKEEHNFPTIYAHDWDLNKEKDKKMFKRWHRGDWNVTGILPFPDMKYIAQIRYVHNQSDWEAFT